MPQTKSQHSVLCSNCGHPNVDHGIRQTCYFCGCMPLPSYSYPRGGGFHPKDCNCEVLTKKEKQMTERKRKTVPKSFGCLLLWLIPIVCQAQFEQPGLYDIPIPYYNRVYHLMFVTEGTIDATSPDIETYNNFVQAEAERTDSFASLDHALTSEWGLDWYAVISTPNVHARENVLTQGIVYDLDGYYRSYFGNGYSTLWAGTLARGLSVDFTQYHHFIDDTLVWTGSTDGGLRTLVAGSETGQTYTGRTDPPSGSPQEWITSWQGNRPSTLQFPIYAVSGPIINGEPVEFLEGDYNGNGTVEQADLDLVLGNWVTTNASFRNGFWFNPPQWTYKPPIGQIDQSYLDEVLLNWGDTRFTPPVPFGVPEPSTIQSIITLTFALVIAWTLRAVGKLYGL